MKTAICPGSFDPVTLGHLDIIERAAELFDEVIVLVMSNKSKKNSLFTIEERIDLLKRTVKSENVKIDTYDGLLVGYAEKKNAVAIVKGLRAMSDFEYEFMMALTNKKLNSRVETVFLASDERYMYLSSTTVREIASYGGDISRFVPAEILDDLMIKLNGRK